MSGLHEQRSDEELMMAYTRGNTAAFDALYTRHESAMLRFIQRILGRTLASHAEEVFQDVWIRIIKNRSGFLPHSQGGASWKTWAFTIAHHAAIDCFRAQNRFIPIEVTENTDDPMEWIQASLGMTHHSSEDEAFWRAAGNQLLVCIESLPAPQRAAFLLHHEEDTSVEEMARNLQLPFETVKSRLRYAMQKLRQCMQHYLQELEASS